MSPTQAADRLWGEQTAQTGAKGRYRQLTQKLSTIEANCSKNEAVNRTFSGTPLIRLGYLLALLSAPALAWLVRRQDGARGIYLIVVIGRAKLMGERFDRAAAAGFDPPLGQSICSQASWFVEIAAPD